MPPRHGTNVLCCSVVRAFLKEGIPICFEGTPRSLRLHIIPRLFQTSLQGDDKTVHKAAFESMRTTICASTSTMTSVPKPLKFLRPHYDSIKEVFTTIEDADTKVRAAHTSSWTPDVNAVFLPQKSFDVVGGW